MRLFIDCDYCDMNHIRREISYVNYGRDVKEAQFYLRETRQNTGSRGRQYSFFFTRQKEFEGLTDTLVYLTRPDDTRDFTRDGQTDMIKMGLMRYVAITPIHKEIEIKHLGETKEEMMSDKWNNWVFEIETRPQFESEESLKEFSFWNSLNTNKITPNWKIEFDFDHRLTRTEYVYDNETNVSDKTQIQLENLVVKSLGEHWSAGLKTEFLSSTFNNAKFKADILLQLQEMASAYNIDGSLGLTYTFGSIFNNIVNPRFGNGGRRYY